MPIKSGNTLLVILHASAVDRDLMQYAIMCQDASTIRRGNQKVLQQPLGDSQDHSQDIKNIECQMVELRRNDDGGAIALHSGAEDCAEADALIWPEVIEDVTLEDVRDGLDRAVLVRRVVVATA